MLWLALYFPDLPLEIFSRGQALPVPLAVSCQHKGRECIERCNKLAFDHGIRAGMTLPAALALYGNLKVRQRDKKREQQVLQGLAAWAYQYSSHIAFDPLVLLLEIGGSRRLFGNLPALTARMEQELLHLGYRGRCAIAPTPAGAGLLVRSQPGSQTDSRAELRLLLRDIPLDRLTRKPVVRELMQHIGLSTIGDCLRLPRPELARRVGPGLALILDKVLGRTPDPRPIWQPMEYFTERLLLLAEINQVSALVFPARRLLASLCGFLRGRDGAAQQLEWQLIHRTAPVTSVDQGLLSPSRNADHMMEVFRERIERIRLPEPVVEIALLAKDWQRIDENTGDLFDDGNNNANPGFLERLRARMGEDAVRGLQPMPDHRPEHAWRYRNPEVADSGSPRNRGRGQRVSSVPSPEGNEKYLNQPLWLLGQPQPLAIKNGRPSYGGVLTLSSFPERIETGWWDGNDIARDYYLARTPAGERLWVYQDRRAGQWYLHGLFD